MADMSTADMESRMFRRRDFTYGRAANRGDSSPLQLAGDGGQEVPSQSHLLATTPPEHR